jgi:RNA recognition motif-containing protein
VGKKLYIGNLPYSVTEADLSALFTPVGEVASVAVITDRITGRAKGFAFVEMASEEHANAAIAQLNGKALGERNITVAEARERTERSSYSGGGGGGYDRRRGGGGGGGRRRSY